MPWFLQWRRLLSIYRSASGGVCVVLGGRWFHVRRLGDSRNTRSRVRAGAARRESMSPLEQYFNAVPVLECSQLSGHNEVRSSGSQSTPQTSRSISWWAALAQRAMAAARRMMPSAKRATELE